MAVGLSNPRVCSKKQVLQTVGPPLYLPIGSKRRKCRRLDEPPKVIKDGESAEELTWIYLSCLHTHFISVLEKRLSPSVVRTIPMDFVVTVPAIWSHAAKATTERAAAKAGFCGNKRILLISEPVHP